MLLLVLALTWFSGWVPLLVCCQLVVSTVWLTVSLSVGWTFLLDSSVQMDFSFWCFQFLFLQGGSSSKSVSSSEFDTKLKVYLKTKRRSSSGAHAAAAGTLSLSLSHTHTHSLSLSRSPPLWGVFKHLQLFISLTYISLSSPNGDFFMLLHVLTFGFELYLLTWWVKLRLSF